MFKRFATLALVALSVVTTGCATRQENALVGTVTGLAAGAALGNTGTALLGGVVGAVIGSNIPGTQERVVRVGGSAPYRVSYSSSSLSPDACNGGYSQTRLPGGGTTWICSGANVPSGLFAGHETTIVRGETIRMKAKCEFATFTAYADDASGCEKIAQAMTVRKPSACSVDGRSDLQNLSGLTEAQCAAIAKLAGSKSGLSVASTQQTANGTPSASKVEATQFANGGSANLCRLRKDGVVLATQEIPATITEEAAKRSYCGNWQQGEARTRGLL